MVASRLSTKSAALRAYQRRTLAADALIASTSGSISPQKWRHLDRAHDSILQTNVRGLLQSAPEDRDCASA